MLNKQFFDHVRGEIFGGRLTQVQVAGMNVIFNECIDQAISDRSWIAYIFATTFHETDKTMEPIREYGGNRYFHRMYDIQGSRPHVAKELGNTEPGDGVLFHGRGYVQLTGRRNYIFQGKKHDLDLVNNPDWVMSPVTAAKILVGGMLGGDFTGKSLASYTRDGQLDYVKARRIINGRDRAEKIAEYAESFERAIESMRHRS